MQLSKTISEETERLSKRFFVNILLHFAVVPDILNREKRRQVGQPETKVAAIEKNCCKFQELLAESKVQADNVRDIEGSSV